jgi:hypothetical protein
MDPIPIGRNGRWEDYVEQNIGQNKSVLATNTLLHTIILFLLDDPIKIRQRIK